MKIEQPGAYTFLQLLDTPNSYLGESGKFTAVNLLETALTFQTGGGGGGSPGGINGSVQYNNAGAFAGGSLTWNESFKTLDTDGGGISAVDVYLTGGTFRGTLNASASNLSADRSYGFPDMSGVIALLESLSIDSSATSGPATYDNTTGVFSIPDYSAGTSGLTPSQVFSFVSIRM